MQVLAFILSLLLDVRARIPNQPSFGSGPTDASNSMPRVRAVAALLVTAAFVAALVWLAVRLVMALL